MDTKRGTEVAFSSLVGEHLLDGVDMSSEQVSRWGSSYENASVIRFRLDGMVYTAVEDPSDGYRSSMDRLYVADDEMRNVFAPVKVLVRQVDHGRYGSASDLLEMIDCANGKTILRVGTENCDDYYPSFVADWNPQDMAVNAPHHSLQP